MLKKKKEEVHETQVVHETHNPREIKSIDLSKDRKASADRLEELKAGRHVDDIPLNDDYWKALRKHQTAHQKGTLK